MEMYMYLFQASWQHYLVAMEQTEHRTRNEDLLFFNRQSDSAAN